MTYCAIISLLVEVRFEGVEVLPRRMSINSPVGQSKDKDTASQPSQSHYSCVHRIQQNIPLTYLEIVETMGVIQKGDKVLVSGASGFIAV